MVYAVFADVQSLTRTQFTASSPCTANDVAGFLAQSAGEIDSVLSFRGS